MICWEWEVWWEGTGWEGDEGRRKKRAEEMGGGGCQESSVKASRRAQAWGSHITHTHIERAIRFEECPWTHGEIWFKIGLFFFSSFLLDACRGYWKRLIVDSWPHEPGRVSFMLSCFCLVSHTVYDMGLSLVLVYLLLWPFTIFFPRIRRLYSVFLPYLPPTALILFCFDVLHLSLWTSFGSFFSWYIHTCLSFFFCFSFVFLIVWSTPLIHLSLYERTRSWNTNNRYVRCSLLFWNLYMYIYRLFDLLYIVYCKRKIRENLWNKKKETRTRTINGLGLFFCRG